MHSNNPIVIVTAIRNEEWILNEFLSACSEVADHIILADQNSEDSSREIAQSFDKVTLIDNTSTDFNEDERLKMLIAHARKFYPEGCVLISIDADEVPVNTPAAIEEWQKIRQLPKATILRFRKPDVGKSLDTLYCTGLIWKLGFVDDGCDYSPAKIHSSRIPTPRDAPFYDSENIEFVHLNLFRERALRAKRRMYCAIENIENINPLRRRLFIYDRKIDFTSNLTKKEFPDEWADVLHEAGIDLPSLTDKDAYFWQDKEVLRMFNQYGTRRFWMDDLWDADWNALADHFRSTGDRGLPDKVHAPPMAINCFRKVASHSIKCATCFARYIRSF